MALYNFHDTGVRTGGEERPLPAEALSINGVYIENEIDGYMTVSVSGRELLENEVDRYTVGNTDGERYRSRRKPSRVIEVNYRIDSVSAADFRNKFNRLNAILNVEQARLVFNDEPDKYFTGTLDSVNQVSPGSLSAGGSFSFLCSDPMKYSVREYISSGGVNGVTEIHNNGTYPSYPVIEAQLTADSGFLSFINNEGRILQFGSPDEADMEGYKKSEKLIDQKMTSSVSGWTRNDAKLTLSSQYSLVGSFKTVEGKLSPDSYGTGAEWHGPAYTKKIPADSSGHTGAKNCTFEWDNEMLASTADQCGCFQITMNDASRKNVAYVTFYKISGGTFAGTYFLGANGNAFGHTGFNMTTGNKTASEASGRSSIEKYGEQLIFTVGGVRSTYYVPELKDVEVREVSMFFGAWKTKPVLNKNLLGYVGFTTHGVDAWRKVPNKFKKNDIVRVDVAEGEIYVNNVSVPGLGALGNDWEGFSIKPGVSSIQCFYSDFSAAPVVQIRYREAYL